VEIPLNSISYAFSHPVENEIGYISIRTFGSTTPTEFRTNLKKLIREHKIKSLVLDLRGNSGGSLFAAIEISDYFLEKGKIIVYIRSRNKEEKFRAKENNQFEGFPLVVLINRQSASASEIVASALKDHKKAFIVGTRSWGKGLVETVHRLSLNCAIALTSAKYYTPSNRCLQRDFSDYDQYFSVPWQKDYDTDQSIKGGVIPDFIISDDQYPPFITDLISRGIFFRFSRKLLENQTEVEKTFKADESITRQFIRFLRENNLESQANKSSSYLEWIQQEIERDVITSKFSPEEGVKLFLKNDPVVKKAVAILMKSIEKGA
jgi:carboxyl-terminal processing protease